MYHQFLGELGQNILRSRKGLQNFEEPPPEWDAKVTAIQEAKDLKTLKVEELVGSLLIHETTLKSRKAEKEEIKGKNIALTSKMAKSKKIVIKSESEDCDDDSSEDDEDTILLAKT